MATLASLRQTYLNRYLKRNDGSTIPWTDGDCDQFLTDALNELWRRGVGQRAVVTMATSSTTMAYTLPSSMRVSRIDVKDASGLYIDVVTYWRQTSETQIIIKPLLASGLTLEITGWQPFSLGTLPVELEAAVAMLAATYAYGSLAGEAVNSYRRQNQDPGRVVGANEAAAMSAYWEARFERSIRFATQRVNYAPRAARR